MNEYSSYILYDDPIPYVAKSVRAIHDKKKKDIQKLEIHKRELIGKDLKFLQELKKSCKDEELLIYPVTMLDFVKFNFYSQILTICKNDIPDPKVISMPFLDFLFYQDEKENTKQLYVYRLIQLLLLTLHIDISDIDFIKNKKNRLSLQINKIIYDAEDFDNIKNIICLQNDIKIPDERIHPDIRKAMEDARAFVNKHNGSGKPGTLDDRIICFMTAMKILNKQKIKNMTIRTFNKIYERYVYQLDYISTKTGLLGNPYASMDKPINHWTGNFDKTFDEEYQDLMVDAEQFKAKFNVESVKEESNDNKKEK